MLLAVVAITATACTGNGDTPLVIWSNVPDVAFVVERYNLVEEGTVHFRYVPDLVQALTQERSDADVVIGRWVNTPIVNNLMVPVEEYETDRPNGSNQVPVHSRFFTNTDSWIPLSYNVPVLVYYQPRTEMTTDFAVSFPELVEKTRWRSADVEAPLFAPTSSRRGLYGVYKSLGFSPSVTEEGYPAWSETVLREAIQEVRSWQDEVYGGAAAERSYRDEYLYEPLLRQLENGRVAVAYGESNTMFTWSFLGDHSFGFRWLSRPDGRIEVNENVVYGGVLRNSRRPDRAFQFLTWLTTADVQEDLVREKVASRIDTFGFLEGFSTVPEVNISLSESIYPRFRDRVPSPGILALPSVLPRYWNEATEQVVAPFLENPQGVEELRLRLDRWYRQRGD